MILFHPFSFNQSSFDKPWISDAGFQRNKRCAKNDGFFTLTPRSSTRFMKASRSWPGFFIVRYPTRGYENSPPPWLLRMMEPSYATEIPKMIFKYIYIYVYTRKYMYSLVCEVSPPQKCWLLDFHASNFLRLGSREPKKISKLLATMEGDFSAFPNLPGLGVFLETPFSISVPVVPP